MIETQPKKRTAPPDEELDAYLDQKAPGLTREQRDEFKRTARNFGLDPWKREVYAVTYSGRDGNAPRQLSIVIGYEVFLKMADEFPQYDGYDIERKGEFVRKTDSKVLPSKYGSGTYTKQSVRLAPKDGDATCTVMVYRKDRSHAVKAEVSWSEFAQDNQMWNSKPWIMLEKVAIARAHRLAFPNEFGGVPYISEELPDYMGREEPARENAAAGPAEAEKPATPTTIRPAAATPAATRPPKILPPQADRKAKFIETMSGLERRDPETYAAVLLDMNIVSLPKVQPTEMARVWRAVKARIEEAERARSRAEAESVEIFEPEPEPEPQPQPEPQPGPGPQQEPEPFFEKGIGPLPF